MFDEENTRWRADGKGRTCRACIRDIAARQRTKKRDGHSPFDRIELTSAPPASEVFRITEAAERVDHRERLETFLAAVGRSEVSQTSVEAVLARVQTLELSDADRTLAEEVLAAAAAGELK